MFCPNCGTQNDENNAKCQKCGFNIKGAVAPKFKGTMLMMNAPPGVAQRLPSPTGTGPVAKTAPVPAVPAVAAANPKKQLAKMTMIGVAPPSPGAVAPPAAKPESRASNATQASARPTIPSVPSLRPSSIPRPAPAARAGAGALPPVNPLGGTMLMGAVPEVSAPPPTPAQPPPEAKLPTAALPAEPYPAPAPTASIPAAPDTAAALSTTTPSVAPPAPINPEKLPSEMPTVASAVAPMMEPKPAIVDAAMPRPEWAAQIPAAADASAIVPSPQSFSPDSLALARVPRQQPKYLTWLLAVLTLGIYPLVTWLSQRRKSNTPGTGLD